MVDENAVIEVSPADLTEFATPGHICDDGGFYPEGNKYEFLFEHIRVAHILHEDVVNCIGHADLCRILYIDENIGLLCPDGCGYMKMEPNRVNVHLNPGDTLYVAQVMGGRLPEGATKLPEGTTIKFLKVAIR